MRKLIIGLSILFFALSGIITFKASGIPAKNTRYQNILRGLEKEGLPPESESFSGQLNKEQADGRDLVEELQATIAKLENELLNKKEVAQVNIEPEGYTKKARTLAVLGSGTFRSGQITINKKLVSAVKKLVPDILAYSDYHIVIEGHTDNISINSDIVKRYSDNMELSFLRAKTVALLLVKFGISLEHISVIGYGDIRPIVSNGTYEGRAKNRRVEVKLVPIDKEV